MAKDVVCDDVHKTRAVDKANKLELLRQTSRNEEEVCQGNVDKWIHSTVPLICIVVVAVCLAVATNACIAAGLLEQQAEPTPPVKPMKLTYLEAFEKWVNKLVS